MALVTAFIVIFVAIVAISGILWLLFWLTKPEPVSENPYAEQKTPHIPTPEKKVDENIEAIPQNADAAQESTNIPVADDLKVIEGIGPKISALLNENGIFTYQQLSETKVISLESILMDANLRIADPSTWPEQATLAASGQWDALKQRKNELNAGRQIK